ncbi:MAG: alanyl-tRNA synthetase [Candidatus Omnitrophota bacterium]|jgi:alanyl-tRNA synthetase
MNTDKLRKLYIDFFKSKDHKYFDSDSLVPTNDPTLLFTGAGMNQFKPYFLGLKKDVTRAVSCQKCIRTGDLQNVGVTNYHHTFFEMLGNFSFGNYFKEEAIGYAWEFVTKELGLKPEDLWVSVFKDDNEAHDIWLKKIGLDESRIVRMGPIDNFWPSNAPKDGPNGPCGPCSEIYFGKTPGQGVEIWNLVFTEFDRQGDGLLSPLPQKNIDTGMGLERLSAVMQGVSNNYDTDNFISMKALIEGSDPELGFSKASIRIQNAILDHLRAIVFSLSDGVIPDKEGRGYVMRKLIRRCALHLNSLGRLEPSLYRYVKHVVHIYSAAYPELINSMASVQALVKKEEEAIWSIIENRVPEARIKFKTIALTTKVGQEAHSNKIATQLAYEYYDTHGIPREILEAIMHENHLEFIEDYFDGLLDNQRQRSRSSSKISASVFAGIDSGIDETLPATEFKGYEIHKADAKILKFYTVDTRSDSGLTECQKLETGQTGLMIFDQTPFYAESGGQVGDSGVIKNDASLAKVVNTVRVSNYILHETEVQSGELKIGDKVTAQIDEDRRSDICKNHTATHLLHSALRVVLGEHVKQRGSLVAPDKLRFDFSHESALNSNQVAKVERLVNDQIKNNISLQTDIMGVKEAVSQGAMAFFGEKYGDSVRVVGAADFSKELCGGTHVSNTSEIGLFQIVQQSAVQSGVRRIEAFTGKQAQQSDNNAKLVQESLCEFLGVEEKGLSQGLVAASNKLTGVQKDLKTKLQIALRQEAKSVSDAAQEFNGIGYVEWRCDNLPAALLREFADAIRNSRKAVVVVVSIIESKPQIVLSLSKGLEHLNINAGDLVKEITTLWGGSGGGRPDMAMGGGKVESDIDAGLRGAQTKIKSILEQQ